METRSKNRRETGSVTDVARWGLGCAVAAAAMIGVAILVFLVALALQPPTWVQVVLGAALAIGGAVFGWLVATAWRSDGGNDTAPAERGPDP